MIQEPEDPQSPQSPQSTVRQHCMTSTSFFSDLVTSLWSSDCSLSKSLLCSVPEESITGSFNMTALKVLPLPVPMVHVLDHLSKYLGINILYLHLLTTTSSQGNRQTGDSIKVLYEGDSK